MSKHRILQTMLLSALCGFSFCSANAAEKGKPAKKAGGRPQMPSATVIVEKVKPIEHALEKEYIGNIEADQEVDLQPRISGFITDIKFKEGSLVKKGELLFQIEDTAYRAQYQAAEALVRQAEAQLSYAKSNYHRQKLLAGKNAVSKSNLEEAERLINLRIAVYEQRKAESLEAKNQLSYTKIYAPITGRIGKVKYTRGNYVSAASSPLAKIVSVDPIRVKFSLSEREFQNSFNSIGKLNPNIIVKLKMSNGELYKQPGKIDFVNNIVDDNTDTISVWAKYENPNLQLIPGGYVTALVSKKNTKPIPGITVSAVITDNKGSFVYVLGKNNIPVRRNVEIGEMIGSAYSISKGLDVGEVVIIDGTHKVRPGAAVKPVPSASVTGPKSK